MAFFGLGKKETEKENSCCCSENCTPETIEQAETEKNRQDVKILGGGCARCNQVGVFCHIQISLCSDRLSFHTFCSLSNP